MAIPGVLNFPASLDARRELLEAADKASTSLTSAISAAATTIPVVSTASFPATGYIVLNNEIIRYTTKTANAFTGVTRGVSGTTAAAGTIGNLVKVRHLAAHHNIHSDAIIAIETKLGFGATTPVTAGHVLTSLGGGQSAWQALPNASGSVAGLMSAANFTKLAGIATGATLNQTDAFLIARGNHTGTQTASTISDFASVALASIPASSGSVAGLMSAANFTKLSGIATGATANQTDAFLLARGNHTGTQLASTISNFDAAALAAIPVSSGSVAGLMSAANFTKLSGITAGATVNQTDAFLLARANHTGTQAASTISDFNTAALAAIPASSDSVAGLMSSANFTKLAGIATGATANQTDVFLLDRGNHTGTQLTSTISDFASSVDARISATTSLLLSGSLAFSAAGETNNVFLSRHPTADGPTLMIGSAAGNAEGKLYLKGRLDLGNTANPETDYVFTGDYYDRIRIWETYTGSGNEWAKINGINCYLDIYPNDEIARTSDLIGVNVEQAITTAFSYYNSIALNGLATFHGTGNLHSSMIGAWGRVWHMGTGLVNDQRGISAWARNLSTGTITTQYGQRTTLDNTGGGTVTSAYGSNVLFSNTNGSIIGTAYGFRVSSGTNTGTIGNRYGFHCADQRIGTTTGENFQYFSAGQGLSKFEGPIIQGVLNTVPTDAKLGNNQIQWYLSELDEELRARIRYSDGAYHDLLLPIDSSLAKTTGVVFTGEVSIQEAQFYMVVAAKGNTGATPTFNCAEGNKQNWTLDQSAVTFSFSNLRDGGTYTMVLTNGTGALVTVTWPATVKWSGGIAPQLTGTTGKKDVITLYYDGTDLLATYSLNH